MIFTTYIKAAKFFPKYTSIKNWKHKLREIDGNGKEIFFSKEEREEIKKGLKQLFKDLSPW